MVNNIQEIENAEGLYKIEKVKLYKEIVPLENSFIVKDNFSIKVVRKDERAKRKVQKLHGMSKARK